jgi:hypothetical protein
MLRYNFDKYKKHALWPTAYGFRFENRVSKPPHTRHLSDADSGIRIGNNSLGAREDTDKLACRRLHNRFFIS